MATSVFSLLFHISIVFCKVGEMLDQHGEDKLASCLLVKYFPVFNGIPLTFFAVLLQLLFSLNFSEASSVLKAMIILVHTYIHTAEDSLMLSMSSRGGGYVHFVNCASFLKIKDLRCEGFSFPSFSNANLYFKPTIYDQRL